MDFYFLLVFGIVCFSSLVIVFWFDAGAILQLLDVLQLIPYLLYMQVDHPVIVRKFFLLFSSYYDFNFFRDLFKERFTMFSLPGFAKEGVDSLFVRNSQRYLLLFAILLFCFLFSKIGLALLNYCTSYTCRCIKLSR